ncbi:MAG: bifunctional (p)ppGpp synthetase/guanosine-3',5'-bis(diphosphate) 3'-pyrophosphohydrolase [Clostridiales bacterium]|nr:bifunctional (p)ppGpp synthetase/guanosine-3',5'-bis(diphosphate) 3'-pyrophosphohydrolase [Clostridiales bacterium]
MDDEKVIDERAYLMDESQVPDIPDYIQEKFDGVMDMFTAYASRAHLAVGDLEKEQDLIRRAFIFAYKAHRHQKRKNGEMYIVHPIATAEILAELEVDAESLAAALLHDTVEDTEADSSMLTELFGSTITLLVEGVTKLNKISSHSKEEMQAENTRKMLIAMTRDPRVILIKLADRLHNMRTMQYQTPKKQVEKARETLEIYAPFAEKFGVFKIKWELEDLCLRYLDNDGYYELVGLISSKRSEREAFMAHVVSEISDKLKDEGMEHYDVDGRPKHFYSIYKKLHDNKHNDINHIYDMFACRIIVDSISDCYKALGIVHSMFVPLPGRFKDYIANPKENGYQSLHTTVKRPGGKSFGETTFEVQIRTYSMHIEAEYGIAAHWHYKEAGNSKAFKEDIYDEKIKWVRQFLEAQRDSDDPQDFMELLKNNIVPNEVFVFTPKGKIVRLPTGSCPIDFAYAIHSGIGNHMHGAKVNGRIVPLSYILKSGDEVEVLSSDKIKGPSRDWVKIVKTASARSKINAWFKKQDREENIEVGKQKLDREIEKNGFTTSQLLIVDSIKMVLDRFSCNSIDDLYASIGYGSIQVGKVFGRLRDEYIKTLSEEERLAMGYRTASDGQMVYYMPDKLPDELGKGDVVRAPQVPGSHGEKGVIIEGLSHPLLRIANCCHPVPGDEIIGYVTQSDGVTVHKTSCPNIVHIKEAKDRSDKDMRKFERLIGATWDDGKKTAKYGFSTNIVLLAQECSLTLLFADVSAAFSDEHVEIEDIKQPRKISGGAYTEFVVTSVFRTREQLDRVMNRLKNLSYVTSVYRK